MFKIRIATTEDTDAIQQIYTGMVGSQAIQNNASWDRLIRAGGLLVVQAEGKVIGFGGIDVQAQEQVKWLYLLPQYQGTGLGTEMLARLEKIGWEAGLNSLRLHSAPGAVEFYRRHGYHLVEEDANVTHDHEGIEMVKDHRPRAIVGIGKPRC